MCPLGCGHAKVAAISGGAGATELSKAMPEPHLQQPGSVQGPLRTRVVRPESGPTLSVIASGRSTKENVKYKEMWPNLLGKNAVFKYK